MRVHTQDTLGSCDPYVIAILGKQERKTTEKYKQYSASWADETLRFYVTDVKTKPAGDLLLRVMDWDRMSEHDTVGEVVVKAEAVGRVLRSKVGWEGEASYTVMKEGTMKEVVGRDEKACTVTVRLRVMAETQLKPPEDVVVNPNPKLLQVSGMHSSAPTPKPQTKNFNPKPHALKPKAETLSPNHEPTACDG